MATKYMSNEEIRASSIERLAQIKSAGIGQVELIGPGIPRAQCAAARSLKKQKIEIDFAAPLPLVDCDKAHCLCLYIARV